MVHEDGQGVFAVITDEQKAALEAKLNPDRITQREQNGVKLDYIEAWWAIAEANRIFGFDGWTRETVEMVCVREPELVKGYNGKENWRVGYMAKVRITALGTVREGTGFGSGVSRDPGDAHESAVKEAESDAMKRAFMTFGNPFGLALYDKSRSSVGAPVVSAGHLKREGAWAEFTTDLDQCASMVALEGVKAKWREKVKQDGWTKKWIEQMPDKFDQAEREIRKIMEQEEALMAG